MTDDQSDKPPLSWLDKFSQALSRGPKNQDQLIDILRDAEKQSLLDADALAMIEGVLQVSKMQVRDIMIPRSQMVVVSEDQELSEYLPELVASSHSRFPVIGDDKDEVIGILHAKDLLRYTGESSKEFAILDILRPVVVVPESKRLDVLLKDFRVKRNHMAIVVDEYGGVSGLVTIEDILEQIVGNIEDEFDIQETDFIKKHSDSSYTIKALTPIEEFNQYFDADLSDDEYDTIGGLIMHGFGHMPRRGECIDIGNYHFEILNADQRQIHIVQATVINTENTT